MLECLEVLEFTFGGLVAFAVGFVKDFDTGNFTAVVDVGGEAEPALEEVAEEIDFAGILGVQFQWFLLAFVGKRYFFGI